MGKIEELEKETTRVTLYWLPPTLKYEGLAKIESSSLGVERFEKVPRKPDQAVPFFPKSREKAIPHFIKTLLFY
ncbi:hypothetical protein RRG08_056910 [Elysia crispata]|uniref:Uncharacterized protein n=1 Tax=Elysia crispata TaxID=231223 RepID=A0AAE0Z4B0_9GAST|nr:hypothetical protein RRG08_056910 [Elysia crispata]